MPDATDPHRFQIDLRGIIDLLSNHLYSGPQVYVRELLQNATDAIRARAIEAGTDPDAEGAGTITINRIGGKDGRPDTIVVEDDGIGLDEDEIHRFLATIGQSSKRQATTSDGSDDGDSAALNLDAARSDFIGQFGIGLLSCFIVSDEITVITRSARGGPAFEWRGRHDGTYAIRQSAIDMQPGTRVYLVCREGCEEHFETDRVRTLAKHYGGLLPYPITLQEGELTERLNTDPPPWRTVSETDHSRFGHVTYGSTANPMRDNAIDAYMAFGERTLGGDFFDVIPLGGPSSGMIGAAYILPHAAVVGRRRPHRVYLKHMLVAEQADNLVPDWAFFVTCIIDSKTLRPTASRESFYEDNELARTRRDLGKALYSYLVLLAEREPARFRALISLHYLPLMALCVEDDEAFRVFADWLPFDTTLGRMSLGELRGSQDIVRYVRTKDQFRQIAPVASAQGMCVVNAGHTYEADLLGKLAQNHPSLPVEELDASSIAHQLASVPDATVDRCNRLLAVAHAELHKLGCDVAIKDFEPADMPVLYSIDADTNFLRSAEQAREASGSVWSGLIGELLDGIDRSDLSAVLCFNWSNPLVQRLAAVDDEALLALAVKMLYVQALLLGHQPMRAGELGMLNEGLSQLIERAIAPR